MAWWLGALVVVATVGAVRAQTGAPVPLVRAYAHNDQEKPGPPLEAALASGFCHVEPDTNLIDGVIVVGHDCYPFRPCNTTLREAYLDPLAAAFVAHGGRVHALADKLQSCPTVTLNIDVKTGAMDTYAALSTLLAEYDARYPGLLTTFAQDRVVAEGAVRVLISGNRPTPEYLAAEPRRFAALDGRILENLDDPWTDAVIGWLSQSWSSVFDSTGVPFSNATCDRIRSIAATAHGRGQLVRFWAVPQTTAFWAELVRCGCDLINADLYTQLRDFLLTA
jgi:hypothetical protein